MNAQGYTAANFPGVTFANFNDTTTNPTNTYVLADSRTGANKQISGLVTDADVYIDMPKMKTHYHAGYTGAVKNLGIGTRAVAAVEQRSARAAPPRAVCTTTSEARSSTTLRCRVPDLTLMDAIQAMEGQGPASGTTGHHEPGARQQGSGRARCGGLHHHGHSALAHHAPGVRRQREHRRHRHDQHHHDRQHHLGGGLGDPHIHAGDPGRRPGAHSSRASSPTAPRPSSGRRRPP